MFKIEGRVYESGTLVLSYDLAEGALPGLNLRDANRLLADYILTSLYQGRTVYYNTTYQEFRITGSDGESVEYIKPPTED